MHSESFANALKSPWLSVLD